MEVNQRRYRRVQRDIALLENDSQEVPELTKQELRRLLTQRRTVIGPNGEEIRIPKHMAVDDIIKVVKSEYGLSTAEISGILVALKRLSSNPEFCGKVNRVVASGIESPLRIERPEKDEKAKNFETIDEIPQTEMQGDPDVNFNNIIQFGTPRRQNPSVSHTIINEEEYRKRSAQINKHIADRYRAEAAEQRKADELRRAQNENLKKQLNEHYAQESERKANRKRVGVAVAALFAAMYVTGVVVDITDTTRRVMTPGENLNPLGIHEDVGGKLFNVTPEVIASFTQNVTPLVYTTPSAPNNETYQDFEYSIDTVSKSLKPNTNLTNVLTKYSASSQEPVVVGEIDSYQDFEMLLENGDDALYTSGPAYFANFSRQMVQGMLKDKYGAERVAATYEKKGEKDQTYEFYIRYFKAGSSNERTPEGRVDMTRNSEGRLQTKEYHTLPYEVYELLAMIGEFSDFSNKNGTGPAFDVEGYAAKFTNGDVGMAKAELKERMSYGTEAIKTLLKDRVREETVDYYRYER